MIYTTKNDYISQIITPALGEYAADFDVEAIADDMLIWHNDINNKGQNNLSKSGLIEDESQDFWQVVESHTL